MATRRVPIFNWACLPDSAGEVFFEPLSVKGTNDVFDRLLLVFNDTASRKGIAGSLSVPGDYVATANLIIVWTTTATSGDVEWDFDYRAVGGNDTESLDQTGTQESVNSNDTAPSAAWERLEISIALTDGNFTADDTVLFELFRDGSDAGDTMAAAALIFEAFFEYADA